MKKALDTFRHPIYRHNCAQAIAYKWHTLYPQGVKIVDEYAQYVGGKAPGGLCGALYAAMEACPQHAADIKREFIQKVGAGCCRQIKGETQTPCPKCVDIADELLMSYVSR